jgi:hypothetical protein
MSKTSTRFRAVSPIRREGQEKTFWLRCGTAFENPGKNGSPPSISVKLDALPVNGELVLFEDDGKDDATT